MNEFRASAMCLVYSRVGKVRPVVIWQILTVGHIWGRKKRVLGGAYVGAYTGLYLEILGLYGA